MDTTSLLAAISSVHVADRADVVATCSRQMRKSMRRPSCRRRLRYGPVWLMPPRPMMLPELAEYLRCAAVVSRPVARLDLAVKLSGT